VPIPSSPTPSYPINPTWVKANLARVNPKPSSVPVQTNQFYPHSILYQNIMR
jgi:hypothetical protein